MNNEEIKFTHLWVDNFGWENTIFQLEDFKSIELFARNNKENFIVFCGIQENSKVRILKGHI